MAGGGIVYAASFHTIILAPAGYGGEPFFVFSCPGFSG